ncbi:hypothetical protein KCK39_001750 [Clostridium perfringens]|nr:hypothetical protein [Clostridium perfringens]
MNCDCIVMKSKDIEISIPKEVFVNADNGIRAKLDDDGSFIIEKIKSERRRHRGNRKQLNNLMKNTNLWD